MFLFVNKIRIDRQDHLLADSRQPSMSVMTRLRLILYFFIICLGGACASQPRRSLFLQSPDEILQSVRLLTQLDGGTRLQDYEGILGGRLLLALDQSRGPVPLQIYDLTGSTDKGGAHIEIHTAGRDPAGPKYVLIRLIGINNIVCISMADLERFASASFQILSPSPFIGFDFTPRERPYNPTVGVSYQRTPTGTCVDTITVYYNIPKPNPWGK
jgi:hypothetical protein